jgi:antitoxin MazE
MKKPHHKSANRRGFRHGSPAGIRIAMWGNCMAVRIPKAQARHTGLSVGTQVSVEKVAEGLLIRPLRKRPALKELVARITPQNRHGEIDYSGPVGAEMI